MSWLSKWFSSLFSKPPHKDCIQKALECQAELKNQMPDAEVVIITGPMLVEGRPDQIRFEKGKLQYHNMAAIVANGDWEFYELQHGIPVKVPPLRYWEPKRIIS